MSDTVEQQIETLRGNRKLVSDIISYLEGSFVKNPNGVEKLLATEQKYLEDSTKAIADNLYELSTRVMGAVQTHTDTIDNLNSNVSAYQLVSVCAWCIAGRFVFFHSFWGVLLFFLSRCISFFLSLLLFRVFTFTFSHIYISHIILSVSRSLSCHHRS